MYSVSDGVLKLSRKKDQYFLRFYQDFSVTAGLRYVIKAWVKSEGNGYGSYWLNFGHNDGSWDKYVLYSKKIFDNKWECIETTVPIPANYNRLRLSFSVQGKNTTAWFKNISCNKIISLGTTKVPASSKAIVIDGKVNDKAWDDAVSLGNFRVLGQPEIKAQLNTEVKLIMVNKSLYIAYIMEEPDTSLLHKGTNKDSLNIYKDHTVETFISVDRESFNHILINSLGAKWFTQKRYISLNDMWYPKTTGSIFTGTYKAKTQIGNKKWIVELEIPVAQLFRSGTPKNPTLYVNFTRHRPKDSQTHVNWAALRGKRYAVPQEFQPITLTMPAINAKDSGTKEKQKDFSYLISTPSLLQFGKPVYMKRGSEHISFKKKLTFKTVGFEIPEVVREWLRENLTGSQPGDMNITIRIVEDYIPPEVDSSLRTKLTVSEAFTILIDESGIEVKAATRDGVLRALSTLIIMGTHAKGQKNPSLPHLSLCDAPRTRHRSWVFDGRISKEENIKRINIAYFLRLNCIFPLMFSYGGNSPFPFESHPNIGDMKRTKDEWKEVFNYARKLGLEPIPFWHAWGRAGFIAAKSEYIHLSVRPDLKEGANYKGAYNKNLDPANPEAVKLVLDLQKELIDTLDLRHLLIGHDELHYDDMVSKRGKELGWKPSDFVINSVRVNRDFLHNKKVKMYMWGDMLDPNQNGKYIDMSGLPLLKKLPKDIVIMDWKYEGKYNDIYVFPSIKMFIDAGFTTIGCPWYKQLGIAGIIRDIYQNKGEGVCFTSWSKTTDDKILPEMVRALSLGPYLAWSPEDCSLKAFPYQPDLIFKTAAYLRFQNIPYAKEQHFLTTNSNLTLGTKLKSLLRMPNTIMLDFLKNSLPNSRGIKFQPFSKDNQIGALTGRFEKGNTLPQIIKVENKADYISFLHTVTRMRIDDLSMSNISKKYKKSKPGKYIVYYDGGLKEEIVLKYRVNINDWNDKHTGRETSDGIMGVLEHKYLMNFPYYTWKNPHPEKKISYIEVMPSETKDMNLAVFAATIH